MGTVKNTFSIQYTKAETTNLINTTNLVLRQIYSNFSVVANDEGR